MKRFEGTQSYVATDDLKVAVNAAVTLRRPLLIKGEPGTGKTVLAYEIAKALGAPLIEWNIKSTTKAQQGLYEYDAVAACATASLATRASTTSATISARANCGRRSPPPPPPPTNDLLQELDRMEFHVYETKETVRAVERPIVIITSNNEKELPDAFLRRCFFHYIKFPDRQTMQAIVDVHFPGIQKILVSKAMDLFYDVRDVPGLKKKPSTSELLDWLKLLLHEDMPLDILQNRDPTKAIPPLHGALLKNEQDVMLFERLAFMAKRQKNQG
jgi:MoxR-like ATPase